jgi:NitT/TauT family transport system permease protein
MIRKGLQVTVATVVFGLAWHVAATTYPDLLPAPLAVLELSVTVATLSGPNGFTGLDHLRITFLRVLVITAIALVASVVIGVSMGLKTSVERPVSNVLPVWLTLPDVVVILFAMILFQFSNTSVIVGVSLLTIPFGVVNTWEGTKDIDPKLLEMADVFEADRFALWRRVYVPALLPYLFASGRYLLGMIWKLVLLAEAFGINAGIGAMVRFWYNQADVAYLLAYFVLFVAAVFVIEYAVLYPLEQRTFAWRTDN